MTAGTKGKPSTSLHLLLPLTGALLSSCSLVPDVSVPGMDRIVGEEGVFRDRKAEYLEAQTIPRTTIPDGMDSFIIDDLLIIPEIPDNGRQSFLDPPRPEELAGRTGREVIIQRMEQNAWIVVDVTPSQVWPRIRDYWGQRDIDIAFENPTEGRMETAWFVQDGNVLTREKLRVTVTTGFQDNSAEIRLLHMQVPQATPVFEQVNWPARSMDSEVEYSELTEMSSYLADVADLYQASSASFLARNISSEGKASVVTAPDGTQTLQLRADFDRSWAAVGRALRRSGIEIESEDFAAGTMDVKYAPGSEDLPEEEAPGLFKRVVTVGGLLSRDKSLPAYPFRIEVRRLAGIVEVRVIPDTTGGADAESGSMLLRLIRTTIA
jgi:outer membrane protein assembly factor BamC